ncbi:MAG: 16S rRNA (uracil(1498)-N(3))-methyltransferase [Pseudomonadota bacterium]
MKTRRLYTDQPLSSDSSVVLDAAAAHYLGRVLRARPGQRIWLFNGDGREYHAEVVDISRRDVSVQIDQATEGMAEPARPVVLAQAMSRNEKMDLVIQKACELGVSQLWPIDTQRSVSRLEDRRATKRLVHWRSVVIAASQQCGRNTLMGVAEPRTLSDILAAAETDQYALLLAQPDAQNTLTEAVAQTRNGAPIVLLIGAEGGFDVDETALVRAAGGHAFRAGPRTLRTETAAIALSAALQLLIGDWRY